MRAQLFSLLFAFVFIAGCAGIGGQKLPEQRPADLVIEMDEGGGMLPESWNWYISADSASLKSWYQQFENVYAFKPTTEALDALYATLRENKVLSIKAREEGEVFDRGGTSLRIRFDKQSYKISNSGSSFIMDKWREEWRAVTGEISKMVAEGVEDQLQKVRVKLELPPDSLTITYLNVGVERKNVVLYNEGKDPAVPEQSETEIYRGTYPLRVQCNFGERSIHMRDSVVVGMDPVELSIRISGDSIKLIE